MSVIASRYRGEAIPFLGAEIASSGRDPPRNDGVYL
jgi:hypothetical protein